MDKIKLISSDWALDLDNALSQIDDRLASIQSGKARNIHAAGRRIHINNSAAHRRGVQLNNVNDCTSSRLYMLGDYRLMLVDTAFGVIGYSTSTANNHRRITQDNFGDVLQLNFVDVVVSGSINLFISDGYGGVFAYWQNGASGFVAHSEDGVTFDNTVAFERNLFDVGQCFEVNGVFYSKNMTSPDMINWVPFTSTALLDYSWAAHEDDVYFLSADFNSVYHVNKGAIVQVIAVHEAATGVSAFSPRGVVADSNQILLFGSDGRIVSLSNNTFTLFKDNVGSCDYIYSGKSDAGYFIVTGNRLVFSKDLTKFHILFDRTSHYKAIDISSVQIVFPIFGKLFIKKDWPVILSGSFFVYGASFK